MDELANLKTNSNILDSVLEPNDPVYFRHTNIDNRLQHLLLKIVDLVDLTLYLCNIMCAKITKHGCAKNILAKREECIKYCANPIALIDNDRGLQLWRSLKQNCSESMSTKRPKKKKS